MSHLPSIDPAFFRETIAQGLSELDHFLSSELESFEAPLRPFLKHFFEGHGKRLRASLVFTTGYSKSGTFIKPLAKAAAILEMVHYATLIHDDILDQSLLRQAAPTLWTQTNAKVAVLLGDALFARALVLASEFPTPQVCQIVAQATQKVCSGEILQTLLLNPYHSDPDAYKRVITLKTAALFQAATELGALVSESTEGFIVAAKTFGHELGLAYQVFDDAVDYWSQEKQAGKTLGSDFASGKPTLPLFLLAETLSEKEAYALQKNWANGSLDFKSILERFEDLGIQTKTHAYFLELLNNAEKAVAPFDAIEATPLLQGVLQYFKQIWDKALR